MLNYRDEKVADDIFNKADMYEKIQKAQEEEHRLALANKIANICNVKKVHKIVKVLEKAGV